MGRSKKKVNKNAERQSKKTDCSVLSLLLFIFFPDYKRLNVDIQQNWKNENIFFGKEETGYYGLGRLLAGSNAEQMDLPTLHRCDRLAMIQPDADFMMEVESKDCALMPITDNCNPGYCWLKLGNTESYLGRNIVHEIVSKHIKEAEVSSHKQSINKKCKPRFSNSVSHPQEEYRSYVDGTELHTDRDNVPAIPFIHLPSIMIPFLHRTKNRDWPRKKTIKEILRLPCHAVPKPDLRRECEYDWRISFSVAEILLSQSLDVIQRKCYRVLKAVVKSNINEHSEVPLPSFYLKTQFYWFCEKSSKSEWTAPLLGKQWMKLLKKIIKCLEKRRIKHYFIPQLNLLQHYSSDQLQCWTDGLKSIYDEPFGALLQFRTVYYLEISNWCRRFITKTIRTPFLFEFLQSQNRLPSFLIPSIEIHSILFSRAIIYYIYTRNLDDLFRLLFYFDEFRMRASTKCELLFYKFSEYLSKIDLEGFQDTEKKIIESMICSQMACLLHQTQIISPNKWKNLHTR